MIAIYTLYVGIDPRSSHSPILNSDKLVEKTWWIRSSINPNIYFNSEQQPLHHKNRRDLPNAKRFNNNRERLPFQLFSVRWKISIEKFVYRKHRKLGDLWQYSIFIQHNSVNFTHVNVPRSNISSGTKCQHKYLPTHSLKGTIPTENHVWKWRRLNNPSPGNLLRFPFNLEQ